MSSHLTIPQGYAVVQLDDKQWYPLQVTRYYSAECPDGEIYIAVPHRFSEYHEWVPAHYSHRGEALQHIQEIAISEDYYEQVKWQGVTINSDVYPEQCVHHLALIEEITGHAPTVRRWTREVNVSIDAYTCCCGKTHFSYWDFSQVTIEDALQRAAEYVYGHRCSCTATSVHEYEQRRDVA